MKISMVFVNFRLNQIWNCSVQIKKIKGWIFIFQLKKNYFCQTFTDNARLKNVAPPLDLTIRHAIKGTTEKNSQKNRSGWYHVRQFAKPDWLNMVKHFLVNSRGKFLIWHEARRWEGEEVSKQLDFFPHTDTFHSFG